MLSFKVSDIIDTFGSGGSNVVPHQGVPNMRDLFRDLLSRSYLAVANVAALQATLAADRADGQQVVTLDTYTVWVWKIADATAADSAHIAPTDVGAGAGRWVSETAAPESPDTPAGIGLSAGTSVLVNGQSATIAATITASSRIMVTRSGLAASTAIAELMAGSRVIGAPGSFRVSSQKDDASGLQAGDQSTFDWYVLG
jgi:hypothetical protein